MQTIDNIGIKHAFLCIIMCWTPWAVLKLSLKCKGFNDPRGVKQMLVYQKTMFDPYYCIESFCHLKYLEKHFKKLFLNYL